MFVQFSGGPSGPDGMALDNHDGMGCPRGQRLCVGIFRLGALPRAQHNRHDPTNAFGGADNRTLFVTESDTGLILKAELPVTGHSLYSHA